MKTYNFLIASFILLNIFLTTANAADPVVKIRGSRASTIFDGIDFYNLDPSSAEYPNLYYYYPVITNDYSTVPQNATIKYDWIPVGGTATTGNAVEMPAIKWNNTKNYNNGIPTKSLRLKVTFTWTPLGGTKQTKVVTSIRANDANEAQPIEVKYIADPSTVSLNGSTVSNSNTLSFPCGATQKTLSVPAVATDPNTQVTYYFYYPNGWSGPASSSVPTVTVNSSINSAGAIKVEAKRNDTENFRTKISINITRPLPTKPVINSADILLCNPQTITASANYATSYKWTTTGGITANSPGNTNSAQITGVSDGTVTVAAVSSVCAVTSSYSNPVKVKRSAPLPASLLVTANGGGSPDFMCNGSGVSLHAETAEPGTAFGAWVSSDPANTILNYNGGSAYFNSYVNSCYGITVAASNCFGSVQKGITICVDNCAKANPIYAIYPNPASDHLNVKFEDVADLTALPLRINILAETDSKEIKNLELQNIYSNDRFREEKAISINVADVPKGVYYLHLIYENGRVDKQRVVLK